MQRGREARNQGGIEAAMQDTIFDYAPAYAEA